MFSTALNAKLSEILSCVVENTPFDCTLVETVIVELRPKVEIIDVSVLVKSSVTIPNLSVSYPFFVLHLVPNSVERTGSLPSQLLHCLSLVISARVVLHVFIVDVNWGVFKMALFRIL
jgi:hypothetical protein